MPSPPVPDPTTSGSIAPDPPKAPGLLVHRPDGRERRGSWHADCIGLGRPDWRWRRESGTGAGGGFVIAAGVAHARRSDFSGTMELPNDDLLPRPARSRFLV